VQSSTFTSFLSGHVAFVVGGTSGIGAAIARSLRQAGAHVTVSGATLAEAQAAAAQTAMLGIVPVALNVADDAAVKSMFASFARLDVLINCAGMIRRGEEHDPEVFARVIEVNLNGMMRCCTAARPLLARAGGSIVNIASMLSFFGGGLVPAYSASKGGVAQLTKSLAIAYAPEKIRVNALAPGWIATPLTQALQDDGARSAAILNRTPLGRWGQPEDVAGAALFLCSSAAQFVTGVVLPVDGGYLVA
jgi:NAD(P)-dependent dehydrogenase (short-subunit alcohol dehydrogenase family)